MATGQTKSKINYLTQFSVSVYPIDLRVTNSHNGKSHSLRVFFGPMLDDEMRSVSGEQEPLKGDRTDNMLHRQKDSTTRSYFTSPNISEFSNPSEGEGLFLYNDMKV